MFPESVRINDTVNVKISPVSRRLTMFRDLRSKVGICSCKGPSHEDGEVYTRRP